MRIAAVVCLALFCAGVILAGCQPKPAASPAPTMPPKGGTLGPTPPAKEPAEPAKPEAKTLVLKAPDGSELHLKSLDKVDEAALAALALKPYPGAAAYTVDADATAKAEIERSGESATPEMLELAKMMYSGDSWIFETDDSLDDVHAWAKENLKGWTVGDIKEENGEKTFECQKPDQGDVVCGAMDYPTTGKRYLVVLAVKGEKAIDEAAAAKLGELTGEAAGGKAPGAPKKAG